MKSLTICADDFAQNVPISRGILALIGQGRVSATSVMSQSPWWPSLAPELGGLADVAEIGLHINFTHHFDTPARESGLRLDRVWLRDALLRQIDGFAEHLNRLPDFIDGHQHIHALPLVRQALFEAISLRWHSHELPYLRIPARLVDFGDAWCKGFAVKLLSAGFARRAQALGFIITESFVGLYSLRAEADFPHLVDDWLARCPAGGLVMCHPGLESADADDPIAAVRALEYRYLSGPAFIDSCRRHGVVIGKFMAGAPQSANG